MTLKDPREEEFTRRARALFDERVAHTRADVRSDLARARTQVIAQLESRTRSRSRMWIPAAAAAALVAAVLLRAPEVQELPRAPIADVAATDIELLASNTNLDLLEQMEFYQWVDAELSGSEMADELIGDDASQS